MEISLGWLLFLLLLPGQGKADPSAEVAKEKFEVLAKLEVERQPNERAEFGSAMDLTSDGKALMYLSDALHRLDLTTGQDQILLSSESLNKAGAVGERGQLLATADSDRVIFVRGGAWNCPWSVFMITISSASAKVLTDGACGEIAMSPSKTRLAVVTSQTCEGRACGEKRLLLLSPEGGTSVFDRRITQDFVDAYWEDDQTFTLRYQDRFDAQDQRYYYKTVSAHQDRGGTWRWSEPTASPKPRVPEVEVDGGREIKLRAEGAMAGLVRFQTDLVFGPPPEGYQAHTVRVFRAGDRIVVVRRVFETQPAPGLNPRRREQIAVLKLKEAR